MVALAARGDVRVLPHLAAALLEPLDDENDELFLRAAALLPDRQLLPGLLHFQNLHAEYDPVLDALIASLD